MDGTRTHFDPIVKISFWGQPYPYGYAWYVPTDDECYKSKRVRTRSGIRIERIWVCGDPVTARY